MACCCIHDDREVAEDLLVVHHVEPQAFGGLDVPENRVFLCAGCHDILHRAEQRMSHSRQGVAIDMVQRYLQNQPARQQRLLRLINSAALARQSQQHNSDVPEAGETTETVMISLEIPRWLHHRLKTLAQGKSGLYRYCTTILEHHAVTTLSGRSMDPPAPKAIQLLTPTTRKN